MPTTLGQDRWEHELPARTELLAGVVGAADPQLPVPTCPEWTIARLAAHVGGSQRWVRTIVATRATEVVRLRDVPGRRAPEDPAALPDWLRAGAADLVASVRDAGAGTPVWSWTGRGTAGFWLRRMTHEAVIHSADAALAVGAPVDLAPELAADGLTEWLEILPRIVTAELDSVQPLELGRSLHLHATDHGLGTAGEWFLRGTARGFDWEHGHARADTAVRGTAADLLLLIMRRLPAERVEVLGDPAVLDTWLARTAF